MKKFLLITVSVIILITNCKKENFNDNKYNLDGYWVNMAENKDTLLISDTLILRSHFQTSDSGLYHKYEYNIVLDSIELSYIGVDKIAFIKPFVHKIQFNEENKMLTIENFKNVYPGYEGDEFKYLEKD